MFMGLDVFLVTCECSGKTNKEVFSSAQNAKTQACVNWRGRASVVTIINKRRKIKIN